MNIYLIAGRNIYKHLCAAVIFLLLAAPINSYAQLAYPPPERPYLDENGISIPSTTNIISQTDISIGEMPGGMQFTRYINGVRQRSNLIGDLYVGPNTVATFGNSSDVFIGVSGQNFWASVHPKFGTGAMLTGSAAAPVYVLKNGTRVHYKYIGGTEAFGGSEYYIVDKVQYPNGEVWQWTYNEQSGPNGAGIRIYSVNSNNGFQIKLKFVNEFIPENAYDWLDLQSSYAINNAHEFCYPQSFSCPLSMPWPFAQYSKIMNPGREETMTDSLGNQTINKWTGVAIKVKTTTSSTFNNIYHGGAGGYECMNDMHTADGVYKVTKNGLDWTYTQSLGPADCEFHSRELTVTGPDGKFEKYYYDPEYFPTLYDYGSSIPAIVRSKLDKLGRSTAYEYDGFYRITKITYSDGHAWAYTYDTRGNVSSVTEIAKFGSSLPNRVVEARTFPASCTYPTSCNKPTTETDANGNVTSFTYDPVHGGVLTETGPAVGGVAPVERYSYVQRYAWIKDASGAYVQAASPIWLLAEKRTCRTTATVVNVCAGGSADEVVEAYDYGPDTGPNNLLLRGVALTADGQTQRTCYAYDKMGRKISETKPRAGLSACY